jgi:DNA-binding beta-propeller fold protein YncE
MVLRLPKSGCWLIYRFYKATLILLVAISLIGLSACTRFDRTTGGQVVAWNLARDPTARAHYDLKFGSDGELYVTAFGSNKVLRFNGVTGAPKPDFVPSGSGCLSQPIGLAFGPDGNLYVSGSGTNQILRYNSTGAFMGLYATGGGLVAPTYLVFGP